MNVYISNRQLCWYKFTIFILKYYSFRQIILTKVTIKKQQCRVQSQKVYWRF